MLSVPLKHDHSSIYPVCPESVQHLTLILNPVAIKLWIRTNHISNQWKLSLSMAKFVFNVSREVMAKFCQIPELCRKV
jgi:hypothetical protein